MRTRSAQLASVKRSMRGGCAGQNARAAASKFTGAGMIVDVSHEEHADHALLLSRQHLLDGDGGFGRDHAVKRAVRVTLAGLVLEDEGDASLHSVAVVVVAEPRRVDTESCIDQRRRGPSRWR